MPLLKGKILAPVKPVINVAPTDTVYVIPQTGEQFLLKEEFEKRQALYKESIWTCQCTGVTKLTYKEATESEKRIHKLLADEFPRVFEKTVLELVNNSTSALEILVDEAWRNLHEFYAIGEHVTLKVKAHGKTIRGTIVKIDQTVVEKKVNEESQSLASLQKEGNSESPRKAPKLRPCKYGVQMEEEDKIINSIPVLDLVRETKLPKKDLIRFFIRAHALRSGNHSSNPWIVDEAMIIRYSLHCKPNKQDGCLKENIQKSKKRKCQGGLDENSKPSKQLKLEPSGKLQMLMKNKSTAGIQKSLSLTSLPCVVSMPKLDGSKESKRETTATADSGIPRAQAKAPGKITYLDNGLRRSSSITSSASSCEVPLAKLREKIQDGDSAVGHSAAVGSGSKSSLASTSGKKKGLEEGQKSRASDESGSRKTSPADGMSNDDSSFDVPLAELRKESWVTEDANDQKSGASGERKDHKSPAKCSKSNELATGRTSSVVLYRLASPKSSPKKNSISTSPKKRLKQITLFDMKGGQKDGNTIGNKNTSEKCPEKSSKSVEKKSTKTTLQTRTSASCCKTMPKLCEKTAQKSSDKTSNETPRKSSSESSCFKKVLSPIIATPQRSLPPIALRLQKQINQRSDSRAYRTILLRCIQELTDSQIQSLPENLRSIILAKTSKLKERKRVKMMTPKEREAHLLKKKEELRQKQRKKCAESKQRFEDTTLDLQPLPNPKIVPTPDGVANELFGDIAMVTEFISCFHGLLMPGDCNYINSEKLMMALVAGAEGFTYLSRVLCVLLQTLLQDKLAEEYKELKVPLSEIPVSEYTASELVRLCLRKFDTSSSGADDGSSVDEEELQQSMDNEVSEALIEQLENSEFFELDVESKIRILTGLCTRIMGTYSVQDYMEEKQQEASELWKRRIAEQKEKNDKKKSEKMNKTKKSDTIDKKLNDDGGTIKSEAGKLSGLTIDHFYGDKIGDLKPTSSATEGELAYDGEDMLSAIKRRRKAAEERKQKESEERLVKEREKSAILQQKEDMIFENQFKKAVALAKRVMRHSSIGLDRNNSRYWILHSSQPGLYVEKGWASLESEYSFRIDVSSSSESDSDGRSMESGIHSGSSSLVKDRSDDKTVPHVGQNLWFIFDSATEIKSLMESLHSRGMRESALKEAINKNYDLIVKQLHTSAARTSDVDDKSRGDERMVQGLREEMQDLKLRLVHGGLGGVSDLDVWEKKLSAARDIRDFVECLEDIQVHVLPKFMKGILANNENSKKRKNIDHQDGNRVEEEDAKVEERKESEGLKMWLDCLHHCATFSRFHVLMGLFESCIKWEKSAENMKCRICRKKGNDEYLLLCDECNQPFHLFCLRPVLHEIPVGEWFCPACNPERSSQTSRSKFRGSKEAEESEEEEDEGIADIEHEQNCAICGESDDLVQCSTCPSSFHMNCHDPPLRYMPRSHTWKCVQCKTGVRLRKSRRGQKKKRFVDYVTDEEEFEETVSSVKIKKISSSSELRKKETQEEKGTTLCGHQARDDDDDDGENSDGRLTRLANCRKKEVTSFYSKPKKETTEATALKSGSNWTVKSVSREDSKALRAGRRGEGKITQKTAASKEKINKQVVLDLIDRLRKHRNCWPFLEPVDIEDAPDYYTIISNPIDLRTMEDKCISDVYSTSQQFVDDFALMLRNAEQYNKEDSPVAKCITPLDKHFECIFMRYIPECKYQSGQWLSSRT